MQCKCGNNTFFTEQKGKQVGIYCKECGKWQKWATKDEARKIDFSNKSNDELTQVVVDHFESELKNNFIKNMIQGFEVATTMYLNKIEDGCTIEELKNFMEMNIKNKNVLEKMVNRR